MTRADLVFHNGPVHTMDGGRANALAVAGGRIIGLGDDEVRPLLGPGTDVVDLRGGALLPAFQDAHVHPVIGGLQRLECDLTDLHGLADYLDRIHAYAASLPGEEWIRGAGWYGDVFPGGFPSRTDLDAVTGARPAVFTSHDGHGAWVNTAALRRAGITRDTPDPPDGRILRDADGRPTGMLVEGAVELVTRLLPPPGRRRIEEAILQAQRYLHGLGITAWQDAAVGDALGIPDPFDAYASLADRGLLTARVVGALWWRRGVGVEQVAELVDRRDGIVHGRFRPTAVKIMQDGVCENLTAAVLEPYRGHGHERGISFIDPAELAEATARLDAAGFDVHFHAVGDRAVRECLDAVRAAERGTDRRHQIAHLDLIDPVDVVRMRELGVIANIQPLWARNDPVLVDTKLPFLGEEQQRHHFAFGSLARAGVPLAAGSDWPVSSPNPLWGVHVAVNRTAPPDDPHAQDHRSRHDPLLPEQAVTVGAALAAYTSGAARANHLDHETGTLSRGRAADLVVLDRDPCAVPADELGTLRVVTTVADGRVVHQPEVP
ncbi:amidohydrolase [Saccharopolyspora rosea]|uniref:Amidohydrolase n=1 Tax=Saccharopolyspora rosea TaxID=524884 RepID=A0ABW3FP13_9PSEU